MSAFIKLPRLYVDQELKKSVLMVLDNTQAHYLKNVMRRKTGDSLRIFNGKDGEWLGVLSFPSKKTAEIAIQKQLLPQSQRQHAVHLVFAPIKKARMDWLIEKSVELGVTHLHPVLTQNTEIRQINEKRIEQQIIEAAEQCERFDIPSLAPLQPLKTLLQNRESKTPLLACIERETAKPVKDALSKSNRDDIAFLIGPEGGFTQEEKDMLGSTENIIPISLGTNILRSETAACYVLSALSACT